MPTTSVCTAPLWGRIPHSEHVSGCRQGCDCMTHSEGSNALCYTGQRSSLNTKRLEGKKCDLTQEVPQVPINRPPLLCGAGAGGRGAHRAGAVPAAAVGSKARDHTGACLD